jgi:hypothetical protein
MGRRARPLSCGIGWRRSPKIFLDLPPEAEPENEKKGYDNLQNLLDVLLQYAKLDILNHTE